MAKSVHKGSEYQNIGETWDQNERKRAGGNPPGSEDVSSRGTSTGNDLERVIREEAEEYDSENKENRVLGGERASVNDE